jgi:hypothetical protein
MNWDEWIFLNLLDKLLNWYSSAASRIEREHTMSQMFTMNNPWIGHHERSEPTAA